MQKQEWDKISELVLEVLGLPLQSRKQRLEELCTNQSGKFDQELFDSALALIEASDEADATSAFQSPFEGVATVAADELAISAPANLERTIGPWTIYDQLGSGGMGVVYLAKRTDKSFNQKAALKLVRPGFGSDFRQRFIQERALLAQLNHPGIARLLDGGIYQNETPYLAVELVDGRPITEYSEEHNLDLESRLRLFVQACEAISFAHRNLVVHRDLKPGHIMIDDSTGKPIAKLLDFGIAQLLGREDQEDFTNSGSGPFTPAYAAPEQIRGESITTATDIYSLGVVLYELLSGERPYNLKGKSPAQIEEIVCETNPTRPSSQSTISTFYQSLSGDLDHIVLKALAKEPERRYRSAEALSADILRYLDGLPIEAHSGQFLYRTKKFLSRNLAAVASAALMALMVSTMLFVFTQRLSDEKNKAHLAADEAIEEAKRKNAVANFLGGILRAPNNRWYVDRTNKGPGVTVREVMDETADMIDSVFVDSPDIAGDLHHIMGDTYLSLGEADRAAHHHFRSHDLRIEYFEAPHPKIVEALYYKSIVVGYQGDLTRRALMLSEAIAMFRERPGGNNYPFMMAEFAEMARIVGNLDLADSVQTELYDYVESTFIDGHDGLRYRDALLSNQDWIMARIDEERGDYKEARRKLDRHSALLTKMNPEAAHLAWRKLHCRIAKLDIREKKMDEVESLLHTCLDLDSDLRRSNPFKLGLGVERPPVFLNYGALHYSDLVSYYESVGLSREANSYRELAQKATSEFEKFRSAYEKSGLFN